MPWSPPSPADFKTRFPQFTSSPDAHVQRVLDEAVVEVSESWRDQDRTAGVLYLTAHLLALFGTGSSGAGGGGVAATGAIKRRKVGDVEVEFVGVTSSDGPLASYRTTEYGKRYLLYLRRYSPAVVVV